MRRHEDGLANRKVLSSVVLLADVLISGLAHHSVLSTAVLHLLAGFLLGDAMLATLDLHADDETIAALAELALFSVQSTDGQQGLADHRAAWRLPRRAHLPEGPAGRTYARTDVALPPRYPKGEAGLPEALSRQA